MNKLILLLCTTVLFACKKDQVPAITLEGKWNLQSITIKEYVNDSLVGTDFELVSGKTADFANGQVTFEEAGLAPYTTSYTLSGDQLTFSGTTYTVQNLQAHSVTLFYRDHYGPGEYDDAFITLSR